MVIQVKVENKLIVSSHNCGCFDMTILTWLLNVTVLPGIADKIIMVFNPVERCL